MLARRHGSIKPNEASIPEGSECDIGLDKNFGFSKQFFNHYEFGEEVGRGHFGYTCAGKGKKGSLKGQDVAVKVIPKAKVVYFLLIFDLFFAVYVMNYEFYVCFHMDLYVKFKLWVMLYT